MGDSIRRMLAEQPSAGQTNKEDGESNVVKDEEKKQREHLLALNQVIARQVMEKSRMVAVHALANKKFADDPEDPDSSREVDYLKMLASPTLDSPPDPLPLYQKRDNFLQ